MRWDKMRYAGRLPTRWSASVDSSEALGYLIVRHIPPAMLPNGLRLVREAAGWSSGRTGRPGGGPSARGAAQQHARLFGPRLAQRTSWVSSTTDPGHHHAATPTAANS